MFNIPIISESNGDYRIIEDSLKSIEDFLSESNYVYVSHSITSLGRDVRTGSYKDTHLIISLVYKDLSSSPNQLSKVSKKSKAIVRESVEEGVDIPKPDYVTSFDKKVKSNK